jgi:hypothetical protein
MEAGDAGTRARLARVSGDRDPLGGRELRSALDAEPASVLVWRHRPRRIELPSLLCAPTPVSTSVRSRTTPSRRAYVLLSRYAPPAHDPADCSATEVSRARSERCTTTTTAGGRPWHSHPGLRSGRTGRTGHGRAHVLRGWEREREGNGRPRRAGRRRSGSGREARTTACS